MSYKTDETAGRLRVVNKASIGQKASRPGRSCGRNGIFNTTFAGPCSDGSKA